MVCSLHVQHHPSRQEVGIQEPAKSQAGEAKLEGLRRVVGIDQGAAFHSQGKEAVLPLEAFLREEPDSREDLLAASLP